MTSDDIRTALLVIADEIERRNYRSAERQIGELIDSLPSPDLCAFCGGDRAVPRQVFLHGSDRSVLICRACVRASASLLDDLDGIAKIRPPERPAASDTEVRGRLLELRPVTAPADQADADPATRGPIGGGR